MRRLLHRISHFFGHNRGEVETWWDGDRLMVGFRCDGCGEISGAHEGATSRQRREQPPAPTPKEPTP